MGLGRAVDQENRLARILDAKGRSIGVDKAALEVQVEERKEREKAAKDRDEAFAKLSQHFTDQLTLMQQEADILKRQYNKDVQGFREAAQLKYTRKEWDINRPDAKKLDIPARVGNDDERCGPSSLQKFDGEDLSAGSRMKAQMDQSRRWWDEQSSIKEALKTAEKEAEASHAELIKYQDMLQRASQAEEASVRRELNRATAEYNKRQAEEKHLADVARKQAELAANLAELEATSSSPFMVEDPNVAASALSPYRVRKDHYKGMSETDRSAIMNTRLAQVEEKRAREAQQALEDVSYARSQHDIQRALNEQSQRVDDFRKQQAQQVQSILNKQTEEKRERDSELKTLYQNKISPAFFGQFGTSIR